MAKSAKTPKKDFAQSALSAVEKAIGGKLSNGSIQARKAITPKRKTRQR